MQYLAIRTAIHIAAIFAIYLSLAMLIPAGVDLYFGHEDWQVFTFSALLTGGLALAIAAATQGRPPKLSARFGFFVVNLLWLTTCAVGAVPLLASSLEISFTDAIFESVSGITATGATVLNGLDEMPPGLLLWRSLLHWMGGLGIIALGLFVLPFLNVGGMSYLRIESSDITDRPFERFSTYTTSLFAFYFAVTLLCAICYAAAGMNGFNAINHAMSTVSTGGFSTHDISMGVYADNLAIFWVSIVFMILGALPFSIILLLAVRGRFDALGDPQIRIFLGYTICFAVAVTIYLRLTTEMPFADAVTHATFTLVSIITTTGFASVDYSEWGPFAIACIFVATFLGGCSGSTTGGIKAYRFLILYELFVNGLRQLVYPHTVQIVRYGDRVVADPMQRAVVLFIAAFFVLWLITTVLLGATGLDIVTAMTGALTALTNVGPGLGDVIGPAGNFSAVPETAKWILSVTMLMGRLEILAVLVIFTPIFWNR